MGTTWAPLIANLFLFCYERNSMMSLSGYTHADVIKGYNSTSRYLDDLLNNDSPYFEGMVSQIYPSELQLNKTNTSDFKASFLDLHLSMLDGFVSSKTYDKRNDFDFDIVNFPFLDCDCPRTTSKCVYISQVIRFFGRVSSHLNDFNARNKRLTATLYNKGIGIINFKKTCSKFYRRLFELVSKYNTGFRSCLQQGLSEPEFYGNLVYKL